MYRVVVEASIGWRVLPGKRYTNPDFPNIEVTEDEREMYHILDSGRDIGKKFYTINKAFDYIRRSY